MKIRRFKPSDTDQIAQLFHDTVRNVNAKDYSPKQVNAWAPDDIHFRDWRASCEEKFTLVAEENGIITGFTQLEEDGHIDYFYCHKDCQGKGIGTKLYQAIEATAGEQGIGRLCVEASITAKSFFLTMGFSVIKAQKVKTRGQVLKNFKMEKELIFNPSKNHPSIS